MTKNELTRTWKVISSFAVKYAVWLIIGLFIVANILLFVSYQQSNRVEVKGLYKELSVTENKTAQIAIQSKIDLKTDLWSQIWSFGSTDTFKTVAVSILLALLGTALGKVFKIKENIEIKKADQRQKKIDAQTKCIEETAKMWDDLYCVVSDVRFYKPVDKQHDAPGVVKPAKGELPKPGEKAGNEKTKDNTQGNVIPAVGEPAKPDVKPKDEEKPKTIVDLLKQIENYASKAEEVVNKWHFAFPELSKIGREFRTKKINEIAANTKENLAAIKNKLPDLRASGFILIHVNLLYDAAASVTYRIRQIEEVEKPTKEEEDNNRKEIRFLQDSLGVIQDVIKDRVHQRMLALLKYAVEPVDGWGVNEADDIYNRSQMTNLTQILFDESKDIKRMEMLVSSLASKKPGKPEDLAKVQKGITDITDGSHGAVPGTSVASDNLIADWEFKYNKEKLEALANKFGNTSISDAEDNLKNWKYVIDNTDKKTAA